MPRCWCSISRPEANGSDSNPEPLSEHRSGSGLRGSQPRKDAACSRTNSATVRGGRPVRSAIVLVIVTVLPPGRWVVDMAARRRTKTQTVNLYTLHSPEGRGRYRAFGKAENATLP